ncbi:thymidylate synthase [Escherichia phage vB_EcoP_SU7]|uniref:Thymidylate synthase n=1 Tax=Escherichia phage vB_EcoP_SU7 TaxID=2849626 RepID=A0A8F3HLX5_9CAUD|nr:thymidylate synthase [Escherichia phage vB_EcoP_SU7]QWY14108.1 thymidylate synthase [Escherichia phage vB_EcoP_SU7]
MTIKASLIDNFGSDLTVVNAARVTMGVEREELKENDTRLINFLARERHVSPFRHPQASFRCEAPIAIARQLQKHQVGFSWNEMSRRYKDGAVDIFIPKEIFSRPDDLHSGSGALLEGEEEAKALALFNSAYEASLASYDELIKFIAPEQARFVLPQGMITTWYWTGSLYGWFELCRQRLSSHAQYEVRVFAQSLDEEMAKLYPISWAALKKTLES